MSDPVLTSSWCTNWGAFNTPRLWSMVMDEDDGPGRQQVSAWRTLAGSVRSQRAALITARADLVAAWPPEENESSAAFVTELDVLISRLDTASADADATASGLDNILTAIQTAKTTIQPLWEKYKDKSDDLVPRWWDSAEDEIDEQARTAMIAAERAVEDSVALLKVPDKYELKIGDKTDESGGGDPGEPGGGGKTGSGESGITATVPHNPVPPLPGQDPTVPDGSQGGGTGDGSTGDGSTVGGGISSGVGSGGVGSGGVGSGGGGGGPDLAGVITPGQPPVAPGGGGNIGLPGGGGTPLPTGGGGNPIVPGLLPTGGSGPITPGRGGSIRPGSTIGEPGVGGGRAGVGPIGGGGGRGAGGRSGRLGRSGTLGGIQEEVGSRGLRGGSVGEPGVGRGLRGVGGPGEGLGGAGGRGGIGSPGGRGGRGAAAGGRGRQPRPSWLSDDEVGPHRNAGGVSGMPGRGGRRGQGDDDEYGFDPDNPWEVAEGVDPVIAPSTDEPRHDPGPNVIGWR
jgi:hypothetical protein